MNHSPIVIVGAGFGGLGLGVRLRQAGITDFVILERGDDLGGTWSRNTYPGAACDVPSTLYSYSFAPNPSWSHKYATQPEILEYLHTTARKRGVTEHVHLDTDVTQATFDEATATWRISTNHGDLTADLLVSAVGAFAEASTPDFPGAATFGGAAFHTLHWDHSVDLTGKRVAIIGTGATAIQIVPEVQKVAAELVVFQRTPAWIVPRLDRRITDVEKAAHRIAPVTQRISRGSWYVAIESYGLPGFVSTRFRHPFEALGRLQLRRQVSDPELRAQLKPDYMIGCNRAVFSDNFYPALCEDNVRLVTAPIGEITQQGIRTDDGIEHEVDVIVYATGFTSTPRFADAVKGTDGRTMNDRYRERPQSYLGAANAGFPNMFTILGPFGAAGNQSAIFMIEGQIQYIVDAVARLRRDGIRRFEVRRDVQEAFVNEMHSRSQNGSWLKGGCNSYYTNANGENSGLYPNWSFEYRRRTRRFDTENYEACT